jgi:hypothetical protein
MFLEAGGGPYPWQYLLGHGDMTVTRRYQDRVEERGESVSLADGCAGE